MLSNRLPLLLLLLLSTFCSCLYAQGVVAQNSLFYGTMYRPNGIVWKELNSPHFKIVYPEGYKKYALRSAAILEQELPKTNELTGGKLKKIPVVINTWNDLSNGYVSPFHFRIEVELPPILGKSLNQANGDWLTYVMAHELVHASHGAYKPKYSLYGLLSLASPDLYRATNFSAPSGHIEGIAVHHESDSLVHGTGRGNYADFLNQQEAIRNDGSWSMGQLYFPSRRTQPFNRHYIGGHAFSEWLIDTYGISIIRKSHDTLIRFPFLGFGFALKVQTGKWPKELFEAFEKANPSKKREYNSQKLLTSNVEGAFERRPQWIDNDEIVFYGRYYNKVSGFFKASNTSTDKFSRINETRITEDYRYYLDPRSERLWWSAALIHPTWDETFVSTLLTAKLDGSNQSKHTAPKRVYAPELSSNSEFWLIQRKNDRSQLVKIDVKGTISNSYDHEEIDWIAVRKNPTKGSSLAVVAQYYGQQALWIVEEKDLDKIQDLEPDVFFSGHSIFDPEWSPDGKGLIFSSDHTGVRQLYAYKPISKRIAALTNSPFGAMEGQLSPNREQLAYTELRGNEYRIVIDSLDWAKVNFVDINEIFDFKTMENHYLYDADTTAFSYTTKRHFSSIGWLKPRSITPLDADDGFGFTIGSNDLLRRYNYSSDITFFDGEVWHDTEFNFNRFYPGFGASLTTFPVQTIVGVVGDPDGDGPEETQDLGLLDLGIRRQRLDLSLDIPITLAGNIRQSFLQLEPGLRFDQASFYDINFNPTVTGARINDTALRNDLYTKNAVFLRTALGLGYTQTVRDIIPRTGWLIQSEMVYDYQLNNNGALSNLFTQGNAFMLGLTRYLNLWPKKNQQLQLSVHRYWQRNSLYFDAESIIHPALEGNDLASTFGAIPGDLLSFRSRWLIPIAFPENGWVTIPTYFSSVYLSLNHNTVFNMDQTNAAPLHLFGGGLRTQMRFAQIAIDIGIGFFWDSNTGSVRSYFGNF